MKKSSVIISATFSFIITAMIIIAFYLVSRKSHFQEKNQTFDQVLIQVISSDEWVLAKGYYGVIIDDSDKKNRVYAEGLVRVGIKLRDIETHLSENDLTIFYPSPRLLGVDIKKHLSFSDKIDENFYNEALLTAKPRLFKQALSEGILEEAEKRLTTELTSLAQNFYPDIKVEIRKKEIIK